MVLETGVAPEVHPSLLADRHLVSVIVEDDHLAQQGLSDGARVLQPVLRVGVGKAVAFSAGVVLVQHRTPPFDHLSLHLDRTGRGGVDRGDEAGQLVPSPDLFRELQHPDEHGRHPLAPGDVVVLDGGQGPLGIEPLHNHDRAAHAMSSKAKTQRSSVVEGCW